MDFVCILMIVMNILLRDMESLLAVLKMPWDAEDVPDHSTIGNHLDTNDEVAAIDTGPNGTDVHGNRRGDIRLYRFGQQ